MKAHKRDIGHVYAKGMIYKNQGNALRYKAELHRFVGYCMCIPLCMKLCALLMSKGNILKQFIKGLDLQMFISAVAAWAGYKMLKHGFNVMIQLDQEGKL